MIKEIFKKISKQEREQSMLNTEISSQSTIDGVQISLQTGKIAKQANGSVILQCGNTVLLAAVTMAKQAREDIDFFPLTVEYVEKMYAAGKIPGGFFKREAKPRTGAILAARLTDRPIRPSFPKGLYNEVQVVITVLSYDENFPPESLAITAASAALTISDIPFNGPVAGALIAKVGDEFIFNPTYEQVNNSDLEIVVAGTKDAILMVEAGANEVSEEEVLKAINVAHDKIRQIIALQEDLQRKAGKEKNTTVLNEHKNEELEAKINNFLGSQIEDALRLADKSSTSDQLGSIKSVVLENFVSADADNSFLVGYLFEKLKKDKIRKTIINEKIRPDGRAVDQIRPIEAEVSLLPSTHGSALFTRGETQSIGVVTLGTSDDEQIEDSLMETHTKNYYFHYNFPPYSVGETGRIGFTSRRELGHGALAERAIKSILPNSEDFPYTIRLVSEITESNGSSSMASVCSGTLALMDAGAPIKAPVSGIAMGLLIEGGDYIVLSDIQGLEDHYGDMDFKVAGSEKGITALQLDIKVAGLSEEILRNALNQAKKGRHHILNTMLDVLDKPRSSLSPNAPQIVTIHIDPEKVGLVIGPGGKMIRSIEERSKANVSIADGNSGEVTISAKNFESIEIARKIITDLTKEVEVGESYRGKVTKIMNFGAFIEVLPGKEGLVHISKISNKRIDNVEDYLSVGDEIDVKVEEIDKQNRINLVLEKRFD